MTKNTGASGGWLSRRMQSLEFRKSFERHGVADDFIAGLEAVMIRDGVSRSELAQRMGCKPANVTRALRNTTNLTIATMVEMAFALDYRVRVWLQPMSAITAETTPVAAKFATWAEQTKALSFEKPESREAAAECGAPAPRVLRALFGRTLEAVASDSSLAA